MHLTRTACINCRQIWFAPGNEQGFIVVGVFLSTLLNKCPIKSQILKMTYICCSIVGLSDSNGFKVQKQLQKSTSVCDCSEEQESQCGHCTWQ